jgi:transketolase
MRLGRLDVDQCTNLLPDYRFELGKASKLAHGRDVTIIATGLMVQEAMKAVELLKARGIAATVLDIHCIKPLDEEAVIAAAKACGCIVTAEEANILGGLGAAVAEVVCENCPVPVLRVGVRDEFGRSGDPLALMELYHLTAADIAEKAAAAVAMKK